MSFGPSAVLGEGATFALGADGGPINSSDRSSIGFSTGGFSLHGNVDGSGPSLNSALIFTGGVFLGVVLWRLLSSR